MLGSRGMKIIRHSGLDPESGAVNAHRSVFVVCFVDCVLPGSSGDQDLSFFRSFQPSMRYHATSVSLLADHIGIEGETSALQCFGERKPGIRRDTTVLAGE